MPKILARHLLDIILISWPFLILIAGARIVYE